VKGHRRPSAPADLCCPLCGQELLEQTLPSSGTIYVCQRAIGEWGRDQETDRLGYVKAEAVHARLRVITYYDPPMRVKREPTREVTDTPEREFADMPERSRGNPGTRGRAAKRAA